MREIEIELLTGTVKGLRKRFGAGQVRITIGRDPQCDFVLPADAVRAGLEHLDLARDAGRYQLRVNTRDPVAVNGRAGLDGLELEDGDVLELGGRGGPELRVRYVEPDSERDEEAGKRRTADEATVLRGLQRRSRWLLAAVIALVATLFALYQSDQASQSRLGADLATLSALSERVRPAEPASFAEVIARTTPSVYLILRKGRSGESPVGTAWVVAGGVLATNAHVAAAYEEARKAHQRLFARSAGGGGPDHEIVGVQVHPAYAAFNAVWQEYAPRIINAAGNEEPLDSVPGYDVALLQVADGSHLASPLRIADATTLQALKPGEPIAFVGFPMERLVQLDISAPNPVSQVANVVGITTFTLVKPVDGSGQLIEHSLPATGGASGSPIVNERGEVVAMLSAINVLTDDEGQRFSNPAEINFAQRVDVLAQMLRDPAAIDLDALRAEWRRDLGRYKDRRSATEIVVAGALDKWGEKWGEGTRPQLIDTGKVAIDGSIRVDGFAAATHKVGGRAGHYLAVAVSSTFRDIDAAVVRIVRTGAQSKPKIDILSEDLSRGYHPMVAFDLEHDDTVTLIVVDRSFSKSPSPAPSRGPGSADAAPGDALPPAAGAVSEADITVYFVPAAAGASAAPPAG